MNKFVYTILHLKEPEVTPVIKPVVKPLESPPNNPKQIPNPGIKTKPKA